MDKWTELRTAYKLAKLGTLSETARDMGIHRSTVMRHIDVLEESLGVVLFQRNNLVMPLLTTELVFCAHKTYIEEYGTPEDKSLKEHRFLALSDRPPHLYWNEWVYSNIPEERIVLSASSQQILGHALVSGFGVGILPKSMVEDSTNVVEVPSPENWQASVWVLIHRDMMHIPKIRKFLDILQGQNQWAIAVL